jgi:hypothetical protein
MPSGRSPRICETALRTSLTARSTGVSSSNWTNVLLLPSRTVDWISSTPLMPRMAASTRCVTCVSSSEGAAPGIEIVTSAAGKLMSGLLFTSIRMKLMMPSKVSATNRTSGITGLRIAQLEILRII